jgi:hypothetical protein
MFRHQTCRPHGVCFVISLRYVSTIAVLVKINKVFKTLKLSNVIKWLLLHEVCLVTVCTVCVLVLLLCLPGTYRLHVIITVLSRLTVLMFYRL